MTAKEILQEIRNLGGRLEARGDRLHVEAPKGVLRAEHRDALAAFKPELLALLHAKSEDGELMASGMRLEASDIRIAIFVTETDAGLQVIDREIRTATETERAIGEGGVIYMPADMWH